MGKRLVKSTADKKLAGVCGGIADYMNVDPTLVRVMYALITLVSAAFPGVIAYIILAAMMPNR